MATLLSGVVLAKEASPRTEQLAIAGLLAPAEIRIDRWGVPHLFAASEADVFFVQGFNAARDRLFQIDLWRRRGLGQLAEVFGPAFVEQDAAARLFLYRGDMDREWRIYSSRNRRDAEAPTRRFVEGINAYVDWLQANPAKLPWEFRFLRYQPAKWAPEDVIRIRSHGLTRNLNSEVARANTLCKAKDVDADQVRFTLSNDWKAQVPEGLDPCLPANLLKTFQLATQTVRITRSHAKSLQASAPAPADDGKAMQARGEDGGLARIEVGSAGRIELEPAPLAGLQAEPAPLAALEDETVAGDTVEGSNSWVVAPKRSATGRPIMANDPHRAYSAPSLRYLVHLSAPGLDVIGAGEPALPGISLGHNGSIAFGLTIFNIDQEDLYVYELNPADATQYRYGDGWESFRVVKERIGVRGAAAQDTELRFTRHGPILFVDMERNRAYAVRSGWLEPGMSAYFGSLEYMRAKDFAAFRRALVNWGAPTLNQVYADANGNIGWIASGLAPRRPNWDGLLPVPGDGRYEWNGIWRGNDMPSLVNPEKGFLATANAYNIPEGYPATERKLGFEWTNPSRHQRVHEVLGSLAKISLADSERLQNDILSIPARRLLALLDPLRSDDEKTQRALEFLRGWDARQHAESPQAALQELWQLRHLRKGFREAVLPREAAAGMTVTDMNGMLGDLEKPDRRFGDDAIAKRDRLLLATLRGAWDEMEKLQGDEPSFWQWGKFHHNLNEHPLAAAVSDSERVRINVGPIAKNGSEYTPSQSLPRAADFRQTNGPSVRLIIDVGRWDASRAVNHPGQSGDPDSPHYRDLAPLWRDGRYFPLAYSRKAVEEVTERVIRLRPKP